jgi:hypothetical protein
MTELILPQQIFHDDVDAPWVVQHTQEITDDFLDQNKAAREVSQAPAKDLHQVAAIPTIIVEKWMREGFNIFDPNIKASEIVARLKGESLEAFITTNKRI